MNYPPPTPEPLQATPSVTADALELLNQEPLTIVSPDVIDKEYKAAAKAFWGRVGSGEVSFQAACKAIVALCVAIVLLAAWNLYYYRDHRYIRTAIVDTRNVQTEPLHVLTLSDEAGNYEITPLQKLGILYAYLQRVNDNLFSRTPATFHTNLLIVRPFLCERGKKYVEKMEKELEAQYMKDRGWPDGDWKIKSHNCNPLGADASNQVQKVEVYCTATNDRGTGRVIVDDRVVTYTLRFVPITDWETLAANPLGLEILDWDTKTLATKEKTRDY